MPQTENATRPGVGQKRKAQTAKPNTKAVRRSKKAMLKNSSLTWDPTPSYARQSDLLMPRDAGDFDIPQDHDTTPLENYLGCLAQPKHQMARVPDSFGQGTALARSIQIIDLDVTINPADPNTGRFSILTQPTLGDPSLVHNYKTAMVKTSIPWPTDWNPIVASSIYEGVVAGQDIRVDPYKYQLTGGPPFYFSATNDAAAAPALPFGNVPVLSPLNYGQNIAYANLGGSAFQVPPGQYSVTLISADVLTVWSLSFVGTPSSTVALVTDNGAGSVTYVISNFSQTTTFFTVTATVTHVPPNSQTIIIIPTSTPSLLSTANYGAVAQIRPVACSILVTYANAEIFDAGMIAAAWVPAMACVQSFFNDTADRSPGQLQNWESLAQLPGAYNGRLKDGAYCWWAPRSVDDIDFKSPDANINFDYPCLIVSGRFNPPSVPAGVLNVARIEIVNVWEFQTTTILWEEEVLCGNQAMIDMALKIINEAQHSGPNQAHLAFFKGILEAAKRGVKFLGKFAWENRALLVPLAIKAASML